MNAVLVPVSDVVPTESAKPRLDHRASLEGVLQRRVEAMALSDDRLVVCNDAHPFAQAAHDAFYKHLPLTISPDDVWFCLAQGFAHHVNANAEALRHRFVRHAGQIKLTVERPDFVLGRPNPWPEAFAAFSDQIAGHVGRPLRDVVVADFSTTTPVHRAATEVALMDAFQCYFEYEMLIGCGIPAIHLTGAPDDWRDVRRRAASFADYGLERWTAALLPVLDEIEATSRGHGDRDFWRSFFRYDSGSGGTALTGWVQVLFPFLRGDADRLAPNPYLDCWAAEYGKAVQDYGKPWRERVGFDGPSLGAIPSGVSSAPVKLIDLASDTAHDMRFVAGMFGVAQDPATLGLSAAFGWAVVYDQLLPPPPTRRWVESRRPAAG